MEVPRDVVKKNYSILKIFCIFYPLESAATPVLAISFKPRGTIRPAKASIFSGVPVNSKVKLTNVLSTTFALKTSANLSDSTLFHP